MLVLIAGVLGLPVAIAILLTLTEHGPPGRVRWVVILTAGATFLFSLGLLPFAGEVPPITLMWLPAAGPMRLSLATTSLFAIMATAAAAVIVYLMGDAADLAPRATYNGALILVALAAGNLTFLSGHFLLRYVALEIVGLCIAAAPLLERGGRERFVHAGWVYLLLRFGDAGLLSAILLLGAQSGTFEINAALEAFGTLSNRAQIWVNLGFFLAIAVKVGIWPFYAWIDSGRRLARNHYTWLYATLMPNLGLYLLYRVAGLPLAARSVYGVFLTFGVGAGMVTLFTLTQRPSEVRLPARSSALLNAVIWCAALLGGGKLAWWGLLALTAIRLPLYLALSRQPEEEPDVVTERAAGWERWDQRIERMTQRLRDGVEDALERGLDVVFGGISTAAHQLYVVIEQQGLEGLLRSIVRRVLAGSQQLQEWHTGRLRANLWWVVLCMVLAVGLVLAY